MEETTIRLNEVPSILINMDDAAHRLRKVTSVLDPLKIKPTRFSGVKHTHSVVGCGMSHLDILEDTKPMTLILEDDIEVTPHFKESFKIPEGTDAVYLGVSDHGYIKISPQGHRGAVLATQYTNDYKRVFNMCSTHAILYTSERYIKAAREIISKCLASNVAFDLGLASIHRHFNIITPNDPWFYQTGQPEFTNLSLPV